MCVSSIVTLRFVNSCLKGIEIRLFLKTPLSEMPLSYKSLSYISVFDILVVLFGNEVRLIKEKN